MKLKNIFSLLIVTAFIGFIGCDNSTDVGQPKSFGTLNPTTYVAIGNSITAGYQSGALYKSAQQFSYANLIAQQLGATFNQPLMSDPGTGTLITLQSLNPPTLSTGALTQNPPSDGGSLAQPYNNLGVPGAILYDAIDTSSNALRSQQRLNPFYLMIMRSQSAFGKSLIDQASNLKPTFITFWLGNNDVLGYATSGGVKGTNLGLDGEQPQTRPTEAAVFQQVYDQALQLLRAKNPNAKIMVANIPNVTDVPFFTTIPYRVPGPGGITLPIYYRKNKDPKAYIATKDDYILLTAQAVIGVNGKGLDSSKALESIYVLDADEALIAQNAISQFNQIIFTTAGKYNIPIVNINSYFADIKANKLKVAGETFTADFITGGLFSLDGVHPSSKGHGVIANYFIQKMNEVYGANIPYVEISRLPGITAPLGKTGVPFKYSLDMKIPPHAFDNMINMLCR